MEIPPTPEPARATSGHRTTLTAVAKAAGVSIATVSKVVNGRAGVGGDTRTRVEAAINDLGYVSVGDRLSISTPNRELTIELLLDPDDIANPYLSTLLAGAMGHAAAEDVGLVLRDIRTALDMPAVAWAHRLARSGRAGVIEVTSQYSARRERALRAVGLPTVLVDPIDQPRTSVPSIGAANWGGAYAATEHLLRLGHTRIAYLGGPRGAACDVARAHGWAAAMSEAGLPADPTGVPRHSYTFEHGLRAGLELLSAPERPTAIFAGSDISAAGVLEAARQRGLTVPDQLSVVGFDDTLLARTSTPRLTTVGQPIADIGRHAVATLLRLARGEALTTKRIELATELVVRDSTAPPAPEHEDR